MGLGLVVFLDIVGEGTVWGGDQFVLVLAISDVDGKDIVVGVEVGVAQGLGFWPRVPYVLEEML